MAESLGSAVLTLGVEDSQFQAGLRRAQSAAEGFRTALAGLGVATTVGGTLAFVGNQIKQLDDASAAVRTLGVDSDELGKRLRALSIELDNNISQVELTKAAYDVASSGFATAADATQVLRASALGAQGGFAEVSDVARALTGVLNAYGQSADQATVTVDKFLQTQNDGVITVRQYAAEIGNIASIAAASGVSIDQLNAAIATATLRGVPVAQTFTGLRQALSSIIKPSEQAKELAQSLGIQFNVQALQAKGLGGVLADVQQKTGGAADKIAVLLGSVEAQAAVQPLLNDRLVKYNELLAKQADAAGQAGKASAINAQTISGGLQQIGTGFSNLATTLDTTLTPLFGGFIKSINEILVKLNQVSSLAPEKVRAREKQAGDIVQNAIGPFGGSGFFGGVSVDFDGKKFSGTAAGVRESIVQYLLKKELAALNKPSTAKAGAAAPAVTASGVPPSISSGFDINAEGRRNIEFSRQAIEAQIAAAKQLATLEGTALLRLQNRLNIEQKIRDEKQAQLALAAEQSKSSSSQDPSRVNQLLVAAAQASNNVKLAYAEAGAALVKNAKAAADALKSAQEGFNSVLRGGFDFLTPGLQREQIIRARNTIQPLVDRRVINTGLDISTPEKLFQLASFAESFNKSESELSKAQQENTAALKALKDKSWNVQVNVASDGSSTAYGDLVNGAVS